MKKVVIFGVREVKFMKLPPRQISYPEILAMFDILDRYHKDNPIEEAVSGNARGFDRYGEKWAASVSVPVKLFIPLWRPSKYVVDKGAGLKRNSEMADYADGGIGFWDGYSSGTANMIRELKDRHKPLILYRLNYHDGKDISLDAL